MKKDFIKYSFLFLLLILCTCQDDNSIQPDTTEYFIKAVDVSSLSKIEEKNITFYNESGIAQDALTIFKNHGVNTVRLRLWHSPKDTYHSLQDVKAMSARIKSLGMKVWLTVHYSDTWADPGQQEPPENWQSIPYYDLLDSVYLYTQRIVTEIKPEYIQIGNEINSGFLFPYGNIDSNEERFLALLSKGIQAVRDNSEDTKIIMHFAGLDGADWFYNEINAVDYDIIGLSYYPIWHGKNLNTLKSTLSNLKQSYNKDVLIAETAYPFTLGWADWTNNIVGLEEQLILPDYPASQAGQKNFILKVKDIINSIGGVGFCYWGAELVAFDGNESLNGSDWENQALFDFDFQIVTAIEAFEDNE